MKDERAGPANGLLWAARLVPLVMAAGAAVGGLVWLSLVLFGYDIDSLSYLERMLIAIVLALPLVLALFAWRHHLAGGLVIVASALVALLYGAYNIDWSWRIVLMHSWYAPLLAVWAAGGVLHLLYWKRLKHEG